MIVSMGMVIPWKGICVMLQDKGPYHPVVCDPSNGHAHSSGAKGQLPSCMPEASSSSM